MANKTGQSHTIARPGRTVQSGAPAPQVRYATVSPDSGTAGQTMRNLSSVLGEISNRLQDRMDLQADIDGAREGAIAGMQDGLPQLRDDATIRGRAFNNAARDTAITRIDLQAQQELAAFEEKYQASPQQFRNAADSYVSGILPRLEQFDPALAQRFSAQYQTRAAMAENRVKSRHEAIVRDRQTETALRAQMAIQDEMAQDAAALFSSDAQTAQQILTKMIGNVGRMIDTANQIGPDGRPIFSAQQRVNVERVTGNLVGEQIAMSWVRSTGNMAQAIEDIQNGAAYFELANETGEITTVNLADIIGGEKLNSMLPDLRQKVLGEINQQQAIDRERSEAARSDYEFAIATTENPNELESLQRQIDINVEAVGGQIYANDLKIKIAAKTKSAREKTESILRGGAFAAGEMYLNPLDSQSVKDYNQYYETVVLPRLSALPANDRNVYLANQFSKTLVIPNGVKGDIAAAARSQNQEAISQAVDFIDILSIKAPQLLPQLGSERDLNRLQMINDRFNAGVNPADAIRQVDERLDPRNAASEDAVKAEIKTITKDIDFREKALKSLSSWTDFFTGGTDQTSFPARQALDSAALEYRIHWEDAYRQTRDSDQADKAATRTMNLWGRTSINPQPMPMKFPPEHYYSIAGLDDNAWIREQAIDDVLSLTKGGFVGYERQDLKDNLYIVPHPDRTPYTAASGQPEYSIMIMKDGGPVNILGEGRYWRPDVDAMKQKLVKGEYAPASRKSFGEILGGLD